MNHQRRLVAYLLNNNKNISIADLKSAALNEKISSGTWDNYLKGDTTHNNTTNQRITAAFKNFDEKITFFHVSNDSAPASKNAGDSQYVNLFNTIINNSIVDDDLQKQFSDKHYGIYYLYRFHGLFPRILVREILIIDKFSERPNYYIVNKRGSYHIGTGNQYQNYFMGITCRMETPSKFTMRSMLINCNPLNIESTKYSGFIIRAGSSSRLFCGDIILSKIEMEDTAVEECIDSMSERFGDDDTVSVSENVPSGTSEYAEFSMLLRSPMLALDMEKYAGMLVR